MKKPNWTGSKFRAFAAIVTIISVMSLIWALWNIVYAAFLPSIVAIISGILIYFLADPSWAVMDRIWDKITDWWEIILKFWYWDRKGK